MTAAALELELRQHAWAVLPSVLDAMAGVAAGEARGSVSAADRFAATSQRAGVVAVLPIVGLITQRETLFSAFFGGTSTARFTTLLRQALADPDVHAIVLDLDSPGGSVYGVEELATEIYRARGRKPVTAVANSLAASAAYWVASAAGELVVTPGGEVGSIGVYAVHEDLSKRAEMLGMKVTYISAGKYKTDGAAFVPLAAGARSRMQQRVDDYYSLFVGAVARGRGASTADVRNGFGEGRVVGAREAVSLRMADRVATLDEAITGAASRSRSASGRSALHQLPDTVDRDLRARRLRLAELGG
jgi:signal peptide peptidase SppA